MKNKKYTKNTKLTELMKDERAVELLMNKGLYCLGCPMAMQESLEQGCLSHGLDVEKILKELNNHKIFHKKFKILGPENQKIFLEKRK